MVGRTPVSNQNTCPQMVGVLIDSSSSAFLKRPSQNMAQLPATRRSPITKASDAKLQAFKCGRLRFCLQKWRHGLVFQLTPLQKKRKTCWGLGGKPNLISKKSEVYRSNPIAVKTWGWFSCWVSPKPTKKGRQLKKKADPWLP